jgi:hypothetical protein
MLAPAVRRASRWSATTRRSRPASPGDWCGVVNGIWSGSGEVSVDVSTQTQTLNGKLKLAAPAYSLYPLAMSGSRLQPCPRLVPARITQTTRHPSACLSAWLWPRPVRLTTI